MMNDAWAQGLEGRKAWLGQLAGWAAESKTGTGSCGGCTKGAVDVNA